MKVTRLFAFLCVAIVGASASHAITVPTVTIGNPGNAPDTRYIDAVHPSGVGAVGYYFRMGKTEISNTQYSDFLNAVAKSDPYGLYSTVMGSLPSGGILRTGTSGNYSYSVKPAALSGAYPYDDKPVSFVSDGDAMRFANWLHNGQPTGPQDSDTTEDGAYTLDGAVEDYELAAVTRNPGARWWIPSEDEWYKAAYHKNDGVTGNYWDYPTGTNSVPNNNPPLSDTGNSANFDTSNNAYPYTDVGAYSLSVGPYGTFDQGGNVMEWVDTLLFTPQQGDFRPLRGGAMASTSIDLLASEYYAWWPADAAGDSGIRVARLIPEPGGMTILLLLGIGGMVCKRSK